MQFRVSGESSGSNDDAKVKNDGTGFPRHHISTVRHFTFGVCSSLHRSFALSLFFYFLIRCLQMYLVFQASHSLFCLFNDYSFVLYICHHRKKKIRSTKSKIEHPDLLLLQSAFVAASASRHTNKRKSTTIDSIHCIKISLQFFFRSTEKKALKSDESFRSR